MSFETGTAAMLICPLAAELPEDFLQCFAKYKGGRLDEVKDEPVIGWVSGRHLLETEINENTCICGGHLYMNLRKAERKIPSQLLNAICRREELALMQAEDKIALTRKERAQIKADAIEKNLMKMPPAISATPILVDRAFNVLYFGSSSLSSFDAFIAEFMRAVNVEPVPITPNELMEKLFHKTEADIPSLSFTTEKGAEDEPMPGRDFLTWLWFCAETQPDILTGTDLGNFHITVLGPLNFAFSPAKAKDPDLCGAGESVVKKGNPLASAEAKAALRVGKKLRKAKIILARSESEKWTFTFDADTFAFSSLALPEGEEMELNARLEERVTFLHVLHRAMEEYFKAFVNSLQGDKLAVTEKKIRQWAMDRESL
mgnify:CR=1 FL=1